jgi:hypothetical protein
MKRLFLVSLLTLILIASLTLTAQTTVAKFSQDGEFASVSQSIDANSSFSLSVSRNSSSGTAASASISYVSFSFSADFNTLTVVQIVGNIPASDFTGQNVQNLSLNFSTIDLDPTTSFSQTCTIDLTNTTNFTCGDGPTGSMSLSFTQNGATRTRVLALGEEVTVGNFTTRIHQRSDNASANVSGTIFGTSVSGGGATVGINHNSSLELVKNK